MTSSWNIHQTSLDKLPDIDYIKLNKVGCHNKIASSRVILNSSDYVCRSLLNSGNNLNQKYSNIKGGKDCPIDILWITLLPMENLIDLIHPSGD